MSHWHTGWNYIKYVLRSNTQHSIHPPFLYDFVNQVIYGGTEILQFKGIEQVRKQLLTDQTQLEVTDFGAGSKVFKGDKRKVSDVARTSLKAMKYARLLARIAQFLDAKNVLELGTSLGITTAYMAAACKDATICTIEGSESIAQTALKTFNKLELRNIRMYEGRFDTCLPSLLQDQVYDLIFIDGNHQEEATLRYFEWSLSSIGPKTIMVFDDIYWSQGMTQAWERVKAHPKVIASIDLFQMGLVFFNPEITPGHHLIRY